MAEHPLAKYEGTAPGPQTPRTGDPLPQVNKHPQVPDNKHPHVESRRPPVPDVAERRAIREHARQVFDRAVSHGFYPGGGWEPPDNPYGTGPPAGGTDAAGGKRKKK